VAVAGSPFKGLQQIFTGQTHFRRVCDDDDDDEMPFLALVHSVVALKAL